MHKILLSIVLIITCLFSFGYPLSSLSDSSKIAKTNKIKQFFSLKDSDTVRESSKITTSSDYLPTGKNRWNASFSGYICTDLFWDTRQMVSAREGAICLYPTPVLPDINGKDINAHPSFNFVVLNTRVTLRVQAPDALGAKISGMVEGWFMGVSESDINGFAMRHAFIKLDWKSTALLIGQTWHPLFTETCFPQTLASNTGAPFQMFARSPQIRVIQKFLKNSQFLAYINSQRDYLSSGSKGASPDYLRNSAIPEVGLQYIFNYKKREDDHLRSEITIGAGVDYKYLVPRLVTGGNVYTREGVHGGAAVLFGHYCHHVSPEIKWGVKAKAALTQACNEYLMLGGYAVRYYDAGILDQDQDYRYTALNTLASWADLYLHIRSWEVGMFGGYSQNFGSFHDVQDWNNDHSYFARGHHIDFLYRVSARVKYNANKFLFGVEPEYTAVKYGTLLDSKGKVLSQAGNSQLVHGMRILFSATLFF